MVSIGVGAVDTRSLTSDIGPPPKDMIQTIVDSEDTAETFLTSSLGEELRAVNRYFQFNMPQDMVMLAMDECRVGQLVDQRCKMSNHLSFQACK